LGASFGKRFGVRGLTENMMDVLGLALEDLKEVK
jgi:hypothetical protein